MLKVVDSVEEADREGGVALMVNEIAVSLTMPAEFLPLFSVLKSTGWVHWAPVFQEGRDLELDTGSHAGQYAVLGRSEWSPLGRCLREQVHRSCTPWDAGGGQEWTVVEWIHFLFLIIAYKCLYFSYAVEFLDWVNFVTSFFFWFLESVVIFDRSVFFI